VITDGQQPETFLDKVAVVVVKSTVMMAIAGLAAISFFLFGLIVCCNLLYTLALGCWKMLLTHGRK